MKYALLIFLALVGNSSFAQQVTVYPAQVVVSYPVVVYQPVIEQRTQWVPVVTQQVHYVPTVVAPVQPQGYWVQDRGWLLCKERWRYVPYNY